MHCSVPDQRRSAPEFEDSSHWAQYQKSRRTLRLGITNEDCGPDSDAAQNTTAREGRDGAQSTTAGGNTLPFLTNLLAGEGRLRYTYAYFVEQHGGVAL